MFEKLKADILFHKLLKRPDIEKAYKMVPPTDSWYDTIRTVHNSLAEIKKLPHEEAAVTSHDGLILQGIFYPGTSDTTVIWAHGYTSHAERESAFPGLFYHSLGYNVLIPYQRAHARSEGKYISFGSLESRDLLAWVEKVNQLVPGGSIVLHGLSMGGGIVLFASDKEMPGVKCMVSDAPTTNISDAFKNIACGTFKKDGEKISACLMQRFAREFGVNAADYDALQIVKNSRYPIFLTAGSNERMEAALEAIQQANPQETEILILPGCSHGNGMYKQTQMYQSALREFIARNI